jgi:hypothetical protein
MLERMCCLVHYFGRHNANLLTKKSRHAVAQLAQTVQALVQGPPDVLRSIPDPRGRWALLVAAWGALSTLPILLLSPDVTV